MSKIWKRLWVPVIFFILFILSFFLSDVIFDTETAGAVGSFCIFVCFPLFVVSLVWSIVKSVRQIHRIKIGLETMPTESTNPIAKTWHSVAGYFQKQGAEYKEMSKSGKKRFWRFKIIGYILLFTALYLIFNFYESTLMLVIATLALIGGIALAISAAPSSYNSGNDVVKQISLPNPTTIEELFETFKNLKTPLGSPYLATLKLTNTKAMIFGPDAEGFYVYCYINNSKTDFYIGDTFVDSIKEVLVKSSSPYERINDENLTTDECVCLSSSVFLLKSSLFKMFEEYFKTGKIVPLENLGKARVYRFDEQFKLLGQKFDLYDTNNNAVLHVEGTVPLVSIKITEPSSDAELFKAVKQIDQILTTYNIYKDGKLYGTLQKDPSLLKDKFSMSTEDGKFELTENAGYLGVNYTVKLNDKVIGTIMDNLDLTIRNIVFDNSIIFVYDNHYLPFMAAMGVMVAREIARDRNNTIQAYSDN